jgi:glycosyltransferase involved in cell wall biosynthesis
MTLRVVYLGHVARRSGGEIALVRLLNQLGPQVEPIVVLAEDGPIADDLRAIGVQVRVLPLAPAVRDARRNSVLRAASLTTAFALARYVLRLRREIRALAPAVVHTNTLKAGVYGSLAARLARVPVVWHVRDRIADDYLSRPVVRFVRPLIRLLPNAVLVNSQTTLRTLPTMPRKPVLVLRDTFERPTAPPIPEPHPGQLLIGMAGRLAPWKGQELFLDAFAQVYRGTSARARIIGAALFGEDEHARHLHELAEQLGIAAQVEFRGFCEDMTTEYAALDIVVHYSTVAEPYGQVVAEAMAAGRCVLAADEGGPTELITDGVDGVLVAPRDVVALSDALRTWGADEQGRARLARAAFAVSSARETSGAQNADDRAPADAAAELLRLYSRLAKPRRSGKSSARR